MLSLGPVYLGVTVGQRSASVEIGRSRSVDKLGSMRDIVDTSGNELDHIVYDSFGNIVTETNAANGDRFKFAGMQFDQTVGKFDTRPRTSSVRSCCGKFRFIGRGAKQKIQRLASPRSVSRASVQSYSATSCSTTLRDFNSGGRTSQV